MKCQRCGSERVAGITGKCSDTCDYRHPGEPFRAGYVPGNTGIGGGDHIKFDWCLDCGQIQGKWPVKVS